MKISIRFLIILFGVAAADKPASRYGEPKPVETAFFIAGEHINDKKTLNMFP